jgi:hypothetical protein
VFETHFALSGVPHTGRLAEMSFQERSSS